MFKQTDIEKYHNIMRELGISVETMYVVFLYYEYARRRKNDGNTAEIIRILKDKAAIFNKATNDGHIQEKELNSLNIPLTQKTITHLIDRGIFHKLEQDDNGKLCIEFNHDMCESIFINDSTALEELMQLFDNCKLVYTTTTGSNSIYVNNVIDFKETKEAYYVAIHGSPIQHNRVLDLCRKAIKNDLIKTGLVKIIANRSWNSYSSELNADNNKLLYNKRNAI